MFEHPYLEKLSNNMSTTFDWFRIPIRLGSNMTSGVMKRSIPMLISWPSGRAKDLKLSELPLYFSSSDFGSKRIGEYFEYFFDPLFHI